MFVVREPFLPLHNQRRQLCEPLVSVFFFGTTQLLSLSPTPSTVPSGIFGRYPTVTTMGLSHTACRHSKPQSASISLTVLPRHPKYRFASSNFPSHFERKMTLENFILENGWVPHQLSPSTKKLNKRNKYSMLRDCPTSLLEHIEGSARNIPHDTDK